MRHVWGEGAIKKTESLWWRKVKERDYVEYLGKDGTMILKWILKKSYIRSWTGLVWLKIGISGWLL